MYSNVGKQDNIGIKTVIKVSKLKYDVSEGINGGNVGIGSMQQNGYKFANHSAAWAKPTSSEKDASLGMLFNVKLEILYYLLAITLMMMQTMSIFNR